MRRRAGAAHRAQETGIDAFQHQRPVDQRQPDSVTVALTAIRSSVWSSSASTVPNRKCSRSMLVPFTETMVTPSASEMMKNAASEASSFSSVERATSPARDRHDEAGDQPAGRHGEQVEPRQQEADRGAGQDGMRHGVADQAHPPQHQEHADRPGAERQREHAGQRAAHELEFGETGRSGVS